ncbi:glycosyltransferase involved in cell wall biosynthesis [Pontibacter ummariensis]|uniref:Glycosyltransferase involved in cell wall bisynthesis n=1 Tax=Pontibacter ummariensis TaxID=1610492 RepID=A0A239FVL1_9BACT|nr:glycosyltransferase [Pontibacter ummariensis]PRY11916.1 glycosyltransferase involved in cell wall biosynthesis [Pontibacter ummariensis]SNS60558.1 Glycosyltransferase involved in cell wall bisynthesis [Pontibacter ummariensis]
MSEKRILIASLLKPVNDTRLYEKLGLSLAKISQVQVHICGFAAPTPSTAPANVFFHSLFKFRRLSLGRLQAQQDYYAFLRQVKPSLVIVATHELLFTTYLYCRKHQVKLIYDVQENFALNLRAQDNYPEGVKQLLAWGVRGAEHVLARGVDHFLLAEQSYATELPFLGARFTVLENKFKPPSHYTLPATPVYLQQPLKLLYSGTIATIYGIFEAIELTKKLQHQETGTSLTIIGYSPQEATWREVQRMVEGLPFVRLIGGQQLVPHQQILEEIQKSTLGLLPYQPNESTFRCIPTKLFEYMAYALPLLIQENPLWNRMLQQQEAGIAIDFKAANAAELLQRLRRKPYYSFGVPKDVFWLQEEEKLLPVVQSLL